MVYLVSALLNPATLGWAFFRYRSFTWREWKHGIRGVAFSFMFFRFIVTLVQIQWRRYWLTFFAVMLPLVLQFTQYV